MFHAETSNGTAANIAKATTNLIEFVFRNSVGLDYQICGSGGTMADSKERETVALLELLVSSLAQIDALSEILIEKGIIDRQEFLEKISDDRAKYQAMFKPKH
jgi:hypothetical protein